MIKKSKYLILCEAFYPEEFLINDLTKEWEKKDISIEVLTRSPSYPFGKVFKGYRNWLYQKEKWGSVIIHRFPVIQGYHKSKIIKVLNYLSFVFFGSLVALFIGRRYDKVFIYHTGPLSLALPGVIIKKLYKKPITIWSFDLWPATVYAYGFKKTRFLSWFLDNIVSSVYNNASNIIVSSEGFKPELRKYVSGKIINYAPNWPQTSSIINVKSSIRLNPDKKQFTFTGNVGKVQNLENVILAFQKAAIENAELNIFGDGSNMAHLQEVVNLKNIQNLKFWGRVPVNEIQDILNQSDVLILPLMPDEVMEMTLPLKFQTYLSAAKPIFAVMRGEVKRLVLENKLGISADPLNIDEIAEGFRNFLDCSEINKEEIKINSQRLLENVFNRKKIIKSISDIFFNDINQPHNN